MVPGLDIALQMAQQAVDVGVRHMVYLHTKVALTIRHSLSNKLS